jgi:hypothetical protein
MEGLTRLHTREQMVSHTLRRDKKITPSLERKRGKVRGKASGKASVVN